jgi:hypothetical protein
MERFPEGICIEPVNASADTLRNIGEPTPNPLAQ